MSDSDDKYLFCRHCGTCFKSEELPKHESQCSKKGKGEKKPVVSKKVLQDGEDGGPKETQVSRNLNMQHVLTKNNRLITVAVSSPNVTTHQILYYTRIEELTCDVV